VFVFWHVVCACARERESECVCVMYAYVNIEVWFVVKRESVCGGEERECVIHADVMCAGLSLVKYICT